MARRLPSLNALKAFEASARLESFTLAAAELFVTHAAISRHIRDLEEWLGTELFRRTGRGVVLTEAGERYGQALTPLFDGLASATRTAAAEGSIRTLRVTSDPAAASRWVIPRLGGFTDAHPDIELSLDPTPRMADFRNDEADVGLRYGTGPWDDVEAVRLSEAVNFPVCAPSLIEGYSHLKPQDLSEFNLLHEERKQWWADWLRESHVSGVEDWRGTVFQGHLAIEAAEAGQGFALGDQIVCTDALLSGRLARPFNYDMRSHGSYWLVRARGSKESVAARAFREWLQSEMAETNRRYAQIRAKKLI